MVSSEIAFDEAHMTERLRLFLIMALGEAIITTGTAIAEAPTDVATVFAGAAAFALVAALWALYFAGSPRRSNLVAHRRPIRSGHRAHGSQRPIRRARRPHRHRRRLRDGHRRPPRDGITADR